MRRIYGNEVEEEDGDDDSNDGNGNEESVGVIWLPVKEGDGFAQIPTYLTTQTDRRLSIEMKQLLFNLAPTPIQCISEFHRQILQTRDLKILQ